MADHFAKSVLRIVVAHLSQAVGFDSVQSGSLEVLSDVLERMVTQLGRTVHDYTEQCGHINPHINDVLETFNHNQISIAELIDYLQQMENVCLGAQIGKFPRPKNSNFQFPSIGHSHELKHVFSYSPSILQATENLKAEKPADNEQRSRSPMFTIAGKQELSDEDDRGSYASDGAMDTADQRSLTKPEDIPVVSGTAASSWSSFPTPIIEDASVKTEPSVPTGPAASISHTTPKSTAAKPSKAPTSRSSLNQKGDEPFWVQQHAAKIEKQISKPSIKPSSKLPKNVVEPELFAPDKKLQKAEPRPQKEQGRSLWDSPIFSRKPSTETMKKDSIGKSVTAHKVDANRPEKRFNKPKVSITSRIEEVDRLLKDPILKKNDEKAPKAMKPSYEPPKTKFSSMDHHKHDEAEPSSHMSFASPKSMDDAIDAVVHRAHKEADEAELMKFSHLIAESSSSEEEDEAVSHKTEQLLQLEARGLHKHHEDGSPIRPPPTPSPASSSNSLVIDQDLDYSRSKASAPDSSSHSFSSDESEKSDDDKWNLSSRQASMSYEAPPTKHILPVSESKPPVKHKKEAKVKAPKKVKRKSSSGRKSSVGYEKPLFKPSPSPPETTKSVQKIILKKSKAGEAKVMKSKDSSYERRSLPLPKVSASISVPSPHVKEKERKKEKKEKKKKKEREKERRKSRDDIPIPKLTFKVTPSDHHVSIVKSKRPSKEDDYPLPAKKSAESKKEKASVESKVITQTISVASANPVGKGVIIDAQGNQVWICPGCNKPDDGSPMIGCDECDGWYHWPCVGITQEPPENEEWFCPQCQRGKKQKVKRKNSKSKGKYK